MKKIVLVLLAVLTVSAVSAQTRKDAKVCRDLNAGAKNGAKATWYHISTPFTTYDFRDTQHSNPISLQAWLDSGFCVVMDYSATWCGPCWNLHGSGVLEGLYNTFGPSGTNQIRVLWVEGDGSTTTADILGTGTSTQGDWTLGGTVPFPMADDEDVINTFPDYWAEWQAYPCVVFVTPDGLYCPIYGEEVITSFTPSVCNANMTTLLANYPRAGSAPSISGFNIPASGKANSAINFSVSPVSVEECTIAWTFQDGTPATANTANATCTWSTPGTYNVTVTVTNANGSASESGTISINNYTVFFDFEDASEYSDWTFIDADGDGYNWTLDYLRGNGAAHEGSDGMIASASWNNSVGALTPNNWVFSSAVTVPNSNDAKLTWWEKGQDPDYAEEHYGVYIATSPNPNNATIVWEGDATGAWVSHTISLAAFKGQNVYIGLRHFGVTDMFYLDIDDIGIFAGAGAVNINEVNNANINLYPNPTTGMVNIEAENFMNATVIDMTGRVVMTTEATTFDISNLTNGVYMVRINTTNGTATQKIVKK